MSSGVIICGGKEFISEFRTVLEGARVTVLGEAVSVPDLLSMLESVDALGVIMPATVEWAENAVRLADTKKNVQFFVCGKIKKDVWDNLSEAGVIVLPADVRRAARNVEMALERVSPVSFKYTEMAEKVNVVQNRVDVLTKATVVFFSAKGGVGKTTTTVNTAAAVGMWAREAAKQTGQELRVAVIDNNPDGNLKYQFGFPPLSLGKNPRSVAGFRHLHYNSSLGAVLEAMNYFELANVYSVVSPESSQEKLSYNDEIFKLCVNLVQKYFHFVFVDMGVHLENETAIIAIDAATDIIVVSDLDPATVGLLKDKRGEMGQVFGGFDRARLVVNCREKENRGINAGNVTRELGLPLAAELPFCPLMKKGLKKGVPAVCLDPADGYAREVTALAQKLVGITGWEMPKTARKSVFDRVKKLFSRAG
ncbi:MAG: AAA family ATPase [Peptococcaceae bacterium]|nr:AAA family ATPase [Peptococcaceae bacterium]